MGTLYYGSATSPIHIQDEMLAHLKVVMATKLRRGESFTVTWRHDENSPAGRTTLWIEPSIPLRFTFDSADPAVLDPALLRELADEVSRGGSLTLPPLWTPSADAARTGRHLAGPRRSRVPVAVDLAAETA
ncbi:hypothetical protein NQ166_03230 [Microbacterium sp. zg.Y1090]|uniref:DUF7882 family protein n=1 Tax=Microbacterium TaxID=33882 RepID=UPI00214ABB2F|nr:MULTISPECIES: hypothetical protein [unclassified Microbacterium]MCR2812358.1 hypothetical protein [Microbacterium sp. zg.Y1084]MCR2817841.1 hypothetical protein [Microbacterium sp. zg.Y1090]MDL5485515.1 hypothetical protein [Microbacterium sp. zg-Y1211]WIM28687.1 hypothetical protein QNO26_01985 [Microbacterium sp. zg-Y1090]